MTHLVNVLKMQAMCFLHGEHIAVNTSRPDSDQEIRAFYVDNTGRECVSNYIHYDIEKKALETQSIKNLLASKYNDLREAEGIPLEAIEVLETFAGTNLLPGEEIKRISDGKIFLFLKESKDRNSFFLLEEKEDKETSLIRKEELSWNNEPPRFPDSSERLAFIEKCLADGTAVRLANSISGVSVGYRAGAKFTIKAIEEDRRAVTGYFGYSDETVHFKNIQIPTGDII